MASKRRAWISERFGFKWIKMRVLDRRVPTTPWYFGDGSTLLLLLGVQVLTGAFLMLSYSPSLEGAYPSVRYITEHQPLGWFLRALHYWSAGTMVVMLFFHLFRVILVGGYKPPREGTWLIGVALFVCVIIMSFTGYVLRWDERGIYAARVMLNMFYYVPLIGEDLVLLIQGGREFGQLTLSRIFAVHVVLIPLLLLALASWHLYLVIVHGVTAPAERGTAVAGAREQKELYKHEKEDPERGETFYPDTVAASGAMGLVVFMIAVVLALVFGARELYPEANLVERSYPAEEWWFWWYSALAAQLPPSIAPAFYVAFPLLVLLALILLPFIDRSPYRGLRKRPVMVSVVVLAIVGLLYLTDLRRRSPWTAWPTPVPPPLPEGVALTPEAEQGWLLFEEFGCNNCHAIAGQGRQVGPDLADLEERWSQAELRNYILRPPEGVPMPSYEGRLSDEQLDRIVDFVLVAQTFPRRP